MMGTGSSRGDGYSCGCCNKIMDRGQTLVPTFPMTVVIPHVTCNNLCQIVAATLLPTLGPSYPRILEY